MKFQLLALVALCCLPAALCAITTITANINGFTLVSGLCSTASCIVGRFTGLSTNLVQGTAYTITGGPTFTITNLATGNYTWSDDSGTTFYPTGGAGTYTQCASPDLPAITLDTTNSNTFMGPTRLRLTLRFLENNRYQSISYAHSGTGAVNCNSTISNAVDATYQAWVRTSGTAACTTPYTQLTYDLNNALTVCSYYRDETDPNNTVFNGTIIITTVDTGVVIRGNQYPRTLSTSITIKIAFQTNISASNAGASIFGAHITYSAITQQLWNPATLTATLTLITSVQWPYQLYSSATTATATVPTDWATNSIAASPQDSSADINGNTANMRSKCYSSTGATSTGATAQTSGTICNQYWTITLVRTLACNGANSVTLAGAFSVAWGVTCPGLFTGSCATPNPSTDSVSFTTNSTNYCPQLITNNNLDTAALSTYSDTGYSVSQTQFVFGTTTYFQAVITAPILMSNVAVEYVYVTSGGTNGASSYFQRPYTGAPGTYFAAAPSTGTFSGTSVSACSSATYAVSSGMTITDNADGSSNALSKKVRFSILWNACSSAATGDAPQSTTVQVNIRIRYTNQTTVSLPTTLKLIATARPRTLDDTDASTASANVGISTSDSVNGASVASSSSSMMVISILVAIVVATALIVVVAVVVIRRSRTTKVETQMSSVNLASTSSTA
jgi:hypothetical protein